MISIGLEDFRARVGVPAVAAVVLGTQGIEASGAVGLCRREPSSTNVRAGPTDIETDLRVRDTDVWHIGSCFKAVSAALYARLAREDPTRWTASVADQLPDLAASLHPGWSERRIDELLRMRAGVRANLPMTSMRAAVEDSRPLVEQRTALVRTVLAERPRARGRVHYSNLAYVVLAAIIDRLAGEAFEVVLERELLSPLGMASLGFGAPPRICGHPARLSLLGLQLLRGKPMPPESHWADNPPVYSAAGTAHLRIDDWARFVRRFLRPVPDDGVLDREDVETLLDVPTDTGTPMAMGWVRATNLEDASFFMQGSNTLWASTALLDARRERACLIVCNDGRSRVLMSQMPLAERLLRETRGAHLRS